MNFTVKETNDMLEIICTIEKKWRWGMKSILARVVRWGLTEEHLNQVLREVRESCGCIREEHCR